MFTEITSARSASPLESRRRSLCVRGKGCNMRGKRRLFVLKVLEKNVQLLEQRENMLRTQYVKGFGEERGGMKPRNFFDFQEVQNL